MQSNTPPPPGSTIRAEERFERTSSGASSTTRSLRRTDKAIYRRRAKRGSRMNFSIAWATPSCSFEPVT